MARATTNQALALVSSGNMTSHIEEICSLIQTLNKVMQITITEKDIGDHIDSQFGKSVAKRSTATSNRKQLSKARVITTEDVQRLKKAREEADCREAAKAEARKLK